jgi:hypothetical protein
METEKLSEIIAHFIGLFHVSTEDMRMRANYVDGYAAHQGPHDLPNDAVLTSDFSSDLTLHDYDPYTPYKSPIYHIQHIRPKYTLEDPPHHRGDGDGSVLMQGIFQPPTNDIYVNPEVKYQLEIFVGPGSAISHLTQVNVLSDDDYLDMTDGPYKPLNMGFVSDRLADFGLKAQLFTPFSTAQRTDSYDGLMAIGHQIHDYSQALQQSGANSLGTGDDVDFALAANRIYGTYVNGETVTEAPKLDDFMPDRGLAKPVDDLPEDHDPNTIRIDDFSLSNSTTASIGSNLVSNIVAITETGVMSSVTAVLGNYHQIDAIFQSYVYSDQDNIDETLRANGAHDSLTIAKNIASFQQEAYFNPSASHAAADGDDPIFPNAWRVSVVHGDTTTVTTMGAQTTALLGGNELLNLASYLGIGMQYDLVIIGGNVLDMNAISQIALLYDNDWIHSHGGSPAMVQSGNNVVWNQASIHNIGAADRFQSMPDYIQETIKHINDRDATMPEGLMSDPNFQGFAGLNVLYITGNLFNVNFIKQVSVLGDADHVTQAASKYIENNIGGTVSVDTGSNVVANLANITSYDSFGHSTYLGGQLYSDAVLIQGGLVEHDTSEPQYAGKLANELVAFLHDDTDPGSTAAYDIINGGHDISWSLAHPVDVMQTAVA